MIDITSGTLVRIGAVDTMARDILGNATSGLSISDKSIIHLLDDSQTNQDKAQAILDNYDSLTVTADKVTMVEGDADPVITCNDAQISGDADIQYVVLLEGLVYANGTDTVTTGTADLILANPVAGVYEIFMYRSLGNYASGSIIITVSEI